MSGYEEALTSISLTADATLGIYTGVPGQPGSAVPNTGKMYTFVKVTGANQVGLCVAATDLYVGVLQNKPQKPGAAATVGILGVTNVICGGVVAAGDKVAPDASGRAVTDGTNGKCVALQAGTSGAVIAMLIR
jgi:hypothetical protein